MKKLLLLLVTILILSTYVIAEEVSNPLVVEGGQVEIDSTTITNFDENETGSGISGYGTIIISTDITSNNNKNGIYANQINKKLTIIVNAGNLEISNNENGIIGKEGSNIEISGCNLILKDNKNMILEKVIINNSTITIVQSNINPNYRAKFIEEAIDNITGVTGNTVNIGGFKEGINFNVEKAETLFLNNEIKAIDNEVGFYVKNIDGMIIENKIEAVENGIGLEIIESTITFSNNKMIITDNQGDGIKVKDSSVKANSNILLKANKGYGLNIDNSKYESIGSTSVAMTLNIQAEGEGKGGYVGESTVKFEVTDIYIIGSTENGLELKNSKMTIERGSLLINNNVNGYGIYVDGNSFLEIKNIQENKSNNAIHINNNKNGIWGADGSIVNIVNSKIELKDNEGLALRKVNLISNTITIAQTLEGSGENYRKEYFINKIEDITGTDNELIISGFKEGIDLSSSIFNNTGKFSGKLLESNDNADYGFKLEDKSNYNLTDENRKIRASSNTIGFIIKNSTAIVNLGEVLIKNSENNGMEITDSSITIANTIKLEGNKKYGLEITGSVINLVGNMEIDGKEKVGEGINVVESEVNAKGYISIKETTGIALGITNSKYIGEKTNIYISSAVLGFVIKEASEVNLFAEIKTDEEGNQDVDGGMISIKDVEKAIEVRNGNSLKITSETITVEIAKEGIIGGSINFAGQEKNNIEIIESNLELKKIDGMILKNVELISSTFRVYGLGKSSDTKIIVSNNNLNEKMEQISGYGNIITVEDFYEGLNLTKENQILFSGGKITANNNANAIIISTDTIISDGMIEASSNSIIAMSIINSTVNINDTKIIMEQNRVGLNIQSSEVEIAEGNLTMTNNTIGTWIVTSTVNINSGDNSVDIQNNKEIGFIADKSIVTINAAEDINLLKNGVGISNIDSNIQIKLVDSDLKIQEGNIGLDVKEGGKINIVGDNPEILIENNSETGVQIIGVGSEVILSSAGINDNGNGVLVENGGKLIGTGQINITGSKGIGLEIKGLGSEIKYGGLLLNNSNIGIKVSSGGKFNIIKNSGIKIGINKETAIQAEGENSQIKIYEKVNLIGKSGTLFKTEAGGKIEFLLGQKYEIYGAANEVSVYAKGKNSLITFDNDLQVNGNKLTKVGVLAEDGALIKITGNIDASSNSESGLEIRGGDNNNSTIVFNELTANNNGYGIKVSSEANYVLDNEDVNITLEGNTVAAIGVIDASMRIASIGDMKTNNNENGIIIDNFGYLEVEQGIFRLNGNRRNGIEIRGNSQAIFSDKLQTNDNLKREDSSGILLEAGSRLNAKEIETSNNINGILIQNNKNVQIKFNILTAENNIVDGIKIVNSNWDINGSVMKFIGNTNAIEVAGSTLTIKDMENVESSNNDIFLKVTSTETNGSKVESLVDNLNIGNNKITGLQITGTENNKSEVVAKKIASNNNVEYGVEVGKYGKLTVTGELEVSSNTKGAGLKISGDGAEIGILTLIAKYNKYGVEISSVVGTIGMEVDDMEVTKNTVSGFYITESSITISKGLSISSNTIGFKIEKSTITANAKFMAENNDIGLKILKSSFTTKGLELNNNEYGMKVEKGEKAEIKFNGEGSELNLDMNKKAGISIDKGELTIIGNIDNMRSNGNQNVISITAGGKLELLLTTGRIKANGSIITEGIKTSGNGIYVAGEDSETGEKAVLNAKETIIEASSNERHGLFAYSGGNIDAGTIIAVNNKEYGIHSSYNGIISAQEIDITGGSIGIYAINSSSISVTSFTTITGSIIGIEADESSIVDLKSSMVRVIGSTVAIKVTENQNIIASSATLMLGENKSAIEIGNGGSINILKADIEGNNAGINITGTGSISGKTVNLSGNEVAIKANANSNFTISDDIDNLSLTGNTIGLLASGTGSKIELNSLNNDNTKNNETLIEAENNGTVELANGLTLKESTTAIKAINGGSVIGKGGIELTENGTAIEAGEGGYISFSGKLDINGNATGIKMLGGAVTAGVMTITNNETGIEVISGTNEIATAEIERNGTGIKLTGGNLKITEETEINGSTVVAVDISSGSKLSATELALTGNVKGIVVKDSSGTIEINNLILGTEQIELENGTLNINKTSITKQTGNLFKTSGENNIINITGSTIGTKNSKIESLAETTGLTNITANNSQITSKIEDKEESNERQIRLNLTNNSSWDLTATSRLKQLQINNSTVRIGTNTLTVSNLNNTSGMGIIEMEVDISNSENDRLEVEEGLSGKYQIKVTGTKEVSKEDVKEQIRVIKINNGVTNPKTPFVLYGNRINIRGYVYKLSQGGMVNSPNNSSNNSLNILNAVGSTDPYSWYLVNSNDVSEYIKGMVRASELMTFVAKSGMNTMNKRVGDIRRTPEDSYNGVWVRTFGKIYDVSEDIKSSMSLFGAEGGYDMRISKNSKDRYYIGAMIGYQSVGNINIKQEDEERDSTGDGSAPSIGLYGSWIGQDGWYADIAARYIMVETKMKGYSNGQEIEYKPKANYVGFSAEVGKEIGINVSNGALIRLEPKIEISMAQRGTSKADVSDGSEIEFGGGNSINGKLGISAGYQIELEDDKELTPFIELAYNNEFEGKTDVNYIGEQYNSDLSGGGIEASIGLNGYLGKGFNVYSLLSYESGSKQSNFGWNVGVRYGFGGKKELTRNNIKQTKRTEIDEIEDTIETVKDTRNLQRVVIIRDQVAEKTKDGNITKIEIKDDGKYIKQSEITMGQMRYIKELADGLSTDRVDKIIIASHVGDNTGDERLNKRTSIEKAKRVKQIMIRAGIEEEKIEIRGYGSKKQIADNGTKQGRNKNNRIEIFIKR